MIGIAVISILIISLIVVYIHNINPDDLSYPVNNIASNRISEELISDKSESDFINKYIGQDFKTYFLLISFFLLLISFNIAIYLSNKSLGILLGMLIFTAYQTRLLYHSTSRIRNLVLEQLSRLLLNIRNNLSTGMTLDYAVQNSAEYFQKTKPIGQDLVSFIRISENNLFKTFPVWLKNLSKHYKLAELQYSAQILDLELRFNSNQEEAFQNSHNDINLRIANNKKQKNTIFISFLTLDLMILSFLGIIFYIIPSISHNDAHTWWDSASRPWINFITGLLLWGAYLLTVIISYRSLK